MTTTNLVGKSLRTPFEIEGPRSFTEIHARSPQIAPERMAALLQHEDTLLREVHHRVGNSLQIIASMLALDARKVHSEEARSCLENAHRRIVAVATLQRQLQSSREGSDVELAAYLRQLCENLTTSVVDDTTRIAILLEADVGAVSSEVATNMGLIVTELVVNALKHAFKPGATGRITVSYRVQSNGWRLTVSDNGAAKPGSFAGQTGTGLGKGIVAALVRQLNGCIETSAGLNGLGTCVSIRVGQKTAGR